MSTSTNSNHINLCVVDDHPIIFQGIELIIKKSKEYHIELCEQYLCGSELLRNISYINSDVFIIDVCLPDMKGHDLAKTILKINPEAKIGIYTSILEREHLLNSFKSGVLGYLSKAAKPNELIDFIITISKGERHVRGIIADIIFEKENLFEKSKSNITRRESEILHYILNGHKNREIAEKLNIAERTVEFHKQNIYIKLEVSNSVDLYKAAMRLNLLNLKDSIY